MELAKGVGPDIDDNQASWLPMELAKGVGPDMDDNQASWLPMELAKGVGIDMDDDQASWLPSQVFFKEIDRLDIDDDRSLDLFREFLFKYNHSPLMLGVAGAGQILHFVPGKDIMSPQMGRLLGSDKDDRDFVSDIVLGVWFTGDESFAGKEDVDLMFVMDDIVPQLEVFLQLGAIFIAETEHQYHRSWKPSRYQLVVNLEDESVWVLRKPYVSVADAVIKDFASENTTEIEWDSWGDSGDTEKERVVFGRLGHWHSIFNKKSQILPNLLDLTHVHSKRPEHDDPVIAAARRTEFGGIGRTNDFSFKGKKCLRW